MKNKSSINRIFCLALVLSVFFAVAGCNQAQKPENSNEDPVQSVEDTTEETVTYELSLRSVGRNDIKITSNQMEIPSGDYVLSLSEQISDDVVNGNAEGDFLQSGLENAILDIDYPFERNGLDGTVIVAMEYSLSDIPTGQVITVTITEELQERLGLSDDQIVITCIGYEDQLLGSWEFELELPIIGAEDSELEDVDIVDAIWRFEFYEDGTGKWLTIVDEQYADRVPGVDINFDYTLDGDHLDLIREDDGNTMPYIISFSGDNLIMDGRTYMELVPAE